MQSHTGMVRGAGARCVLVGVSHAILDAQQQHMLTWMEHLVQSCNACKDSLERHFLEEASTWVCICRVSQLPHTHTHTLLLPLLLLQVKTSS
jgi:hypothetical protein